MEDQTLRIDVQRLTRRVEQLERALGDLHGSAVAAPEATRDLWADAPAWEPEQARPAERRPTAAPPRPTPPPPPPRDPVDWGALAGRIFTARTLAALINGTPLPHGKLFQESWPEPWHMATICEEEFLNSP